MVYKHIHVSILFHILLPIRLLPNIEQRSLCYTVHSCWLPILYIVVYTCQSQTSNLPVPSSVFPDNLITYFLSLWVCFINKFIFIIFKIHLCCWKWCYFILFHGWVIFYCVYVPHLWSRKWQSTPVFFPGEFHGQRNLEGYSPWGCKQSDTTEWLTYTQSTSSVFFHCSASDSPGWSLLEIPSGRGNQRESPDIKLLYKISEYW